MDRDNLAKLCALLQVFRPDGNDGVDVVFGTAWDEATKGMSNEELAKFYRLVADLTSEIEFEEMAEAEGL